MPVQADDHQHQGSRVHGKELEEVEDLAGDVPSVPLHRHVPRCVQGHHCHRHQQVSQRQAEDQWPHVGFPPLPQQAAEHRCIAACRQQEEDGCDDHADPRRLCEPGFYPGLRAAISRDVGVPLRGGAAGRCGELLVTHPLPKWKWQSKPLLMGCVMCCSFNIRRNGEMVGSALEAPAATCLSWPVPACPLHVAVPPSCRTSRSQ